MSVVNATGIRIDILLNGLQLCSIEDKGKHEQPLSILKATTYASELCLTH